MSTRPSEKQLSGMTVNERLFACGLMVQWNAAVTARKREEMISLLCQTALSKDDATWTAESVLSNPGRYGY